MLSVIAAVINSLTLRQCFWAMPDPGIVVLGSKCLLARLFQGRGGRGLLSGGFPCQRLGTCFFQLMKVRPATPFPQDIELEDSVNPQASEQAGI